MTTCLIGKGLIKYDSYNLVLPSDNSCTLQVSKIFMVSVDGGERDRSGHNISSMRCSASSPDETLRRELKIGWPAEYFWQSSRSFICWWDTALNAWYYFSNKMSHLISKNLLNIINLCIFFIKLLLMSLRILFWYRPLNSARSRFWEKGGGGRGSSKPLDKWEGGRPPRPLPWIRHF